MGLFVKWRFDFIWTEVVTVMLKYGPLELADRMAYACETTLPFLSASISNLGIWRADLASVVWTATKALCTHCPYNLPIKCGGNEVCVLYAQDYWWRSTSHSFCSSVLTWTTQHNWASPHTSSEQWGSLVSCSISTIRFVSVKYYSFPCSIVCKT